MNAVVADAVAGMLLLAVAVYSTAGGTDYGAGIWDLLAGRFRHRDEVRALIDHAMAPVWEANNVWLVFAAVVTWSGFPIFFQSVFASLYPLYTLALLGLIMRGAFFAFRKVATGRAFHRTATLTFGVASVLTPFCFAASLGALASGRVGVGGPVVPIWQACLSPTSVMFGLVALGATAFSGASFLVGDARRYGAPHMVEYFRWRSVVAALVTLIAAAAALATLAISSQAVFHGMVAGPGLPFAIAAVAATIGVALLQWRAIFRWYRILTVIGVGSFVFAWGLGQSPYLLPGKLTIQQAAGSPQVEAALLAISVIALVIVSPSLALLYALDQRSDLESPDDAPASRTAR